MAFIAALASCSNAPATTATTSGPPPPVGPQVSAPPITALHLAAWKAGTFTGISVDRKTKLWYLPAGTDIAVNGLPIRLDPVGTTVTLEASFKPAGGTVSLHGYGFKLLTDATMAKPYVKNGYMVVFEQPNHLDIYRQSSGSFVSLNDTSPSVTMTDGKMHTLRLIVKRASASRVDFVTYVDGKKAATAHDPTGAYTSGTWGPTDLSLTSTALVYLKPFVTTKPH